ncbi:hypothetical protein GCM10027612_86630 [Microbispora bryophytorum subsp. camponoti]
MGLAAHVGAGAGLGHSQALGDQNSGGLLGDRIGHAELAHDLRTGRQACARRQLTRADLLPEVFDDAQP